MSYILTMLAAIKILKTFTSGWWMALISLTVSGCILLFSGWAILYPVLLAAAGGIYLWKRDWTVRDKKDEERHHG